MTAVMKTSLSETEVDRLRRNI
uniref:Uncharacterized protein n=1 Tax=Arundo donax TaxID=35708 RepID=A0A0A9GDB1_ARUDO